MPVPPASTTAELLVNYRKELLAGGISDELADDMTRDAASRVIQANGLQAKNAPQET